MSPVKVKICGITNAADATMAAKAGADALGFVFYPGSPRFITPEKASEITTQMPPWIALVGVFVNSSVEEINRVVAACGLTCIQLHGNESPEFCACFGNVKVIKAFRVKDSDSLPGLAAYRTSAWLLDSFTPGQLGGTGEKFNWELAVAAKSLGRPIILAGGLTPGNAAAAVRHVEPYGLDVSSGVELSPGKKDPAKVRQFIQSSRSVPHTST